MGIYTENLPQGHYLSTQGAGPCIVLAVVTPANKILIYHFNTANDPIATLMRDSHLIAENSHVLLAGGDNTPQSNGTLSSANRYLATREDLIIDGYVNYPGIFVDGEGKYYTTKALTTTREKAGYNSNTELPPTPVWSGGTWEGLTVGGP